MAVAACVTTCETATYVSSTQRRLFLRNTGEKAMVARAVRKPAKAKKADRNDTPECPHCVGGEETYGYLKRAWVYDVDLARKIVSDGREAPGRRDRRSLPCPGRCLAGKRRARLVLNFSISTLLGFTLRKALFSASRGFIGFSSISVTTFNITPCPIHPPKLFICIKSDNLHAKKKPHHCASTQGRALVPKHRD